MKYKEMVLRALQIAWALVKVVAYLLLTLWLLILSLSLYFDLSKSETAYWVQAIGSVLAIWGAFKMGNMQHKRGLEQREAQAKSDVKKVKNVLHRLAQDIDFHIDFLYQAVAATFNDKESTQVHEYLLSGYDLRWPHQLTALQSMDIHTLNGAETMLLADLKTACSFAIRMCEVISQGGDYYQKQHIYFHQLILHRTKVRGAYIVLSPPGWEISPM